MAPTQTLVEHVVREEQGPPARTNADRATRRTLTSRLPPRRAIVRVAGSLLAIALLLALLHAVGVLSTDKHAVARLVVVAGVFVLVIGPWFIRLARSLSFERAARIREHERAELAAHLHDSVLQTLALIQKRSENGREVAALARRQERELRRWLFERPGAENTNGVKVTLERAAADVEELHGVPIEAVVVGDCTLDARLEALVQAAREAMINAAKFSGAGHVDLYAELEPERAQAFVRDRGVGFDVASVPTDRRGVRDSILARMERHGGRVSIRSTPGEGTEIELVVERPRGERRQVGMRPAAPS